MRRFQYDIFVLVQSTALITINDATSELRSSAILVPIRTDEFPRSRHREVGAVRRRPGRRRPSAHSTGGLELGQLARHLPQGRPGRDRHESVAEKPSLGPGRAIPVANAKWLRNRSRYRVPSGRFPIRYKKPCALR